jgi:hypothetical protein
MKTLILVACAVALCFAALGATGAHSGVWTAEMPNDRLQLTLFQNERLRGTDNDRPPHHYDNMTSFSLPLAELTGLTREEIAAGAANVKFSLNRQAGVVTFDGRFSDGSGAGHFDFRANDAFVRDLGTLGYSGFRDDELLLFATNDLTLEKVRGLQAMNYHPTNRELVEVAIFDITPAAVKEFARLGYPDLTLRELVNFRVGRVDAAFIEGMRQAGYTNLSARQLADAAILRVTPAYVRELKAAGIDTSSLRAMTDLKIGHIDAKRIDEYRRAGYANLTARELSEMGIQGVTPAFIEDLRSLGYDKIPVRQLVEMKIFGVTPDYIRKMTSAGYANVPVDKLLKMKMAGLGAR